MKTRRSLLIAPLLVLAAARLSPPARSVVPESLTNEQFWILTSSLSEPGGTFRSENLLSNERLMQHVIPDLVKAVRPGSAYLGVGPEQNFTYIAALKPSIAFIVDIRRGNMRLHLMYKALFELSADRVEFVSRLFSRKRPAGLPAGASAADIFKAFVAMEPDGELFEQNLAAIRKLLTDVRKFQLTAEDLGGIEWIYQTFYSNGPLIQYTASFGGASTHPSYADLMTATDAGGVGRSYLATPESFGFLKSLHGKNLIVPIVGDFAGPKALRGVGRYLSDKRAVIGAFYLSNVEQYLNREGRLSLFCENVAALPLDESSSFIRSIRDGTYGRGMGLSSITGNMLAETKACPK
jgi:hypothetical protein